MRAGGVKYIGSQAANAAVDRLDGALTVADKYVDRYLPGDPADKVVDGKGIIWYHVQGYLNLKLENVCLRKKQFGISHCRNFILSHLIMQCISQFNNNMHK